MRILCRIILLLCLFVVAVSSYHNDPYKILGVSRASSAKEIKKAYKKLVLEWHPDRNQDEKANEMFVRIKTAYEVLSDPQRKEKYDRYGSFDESPQRHPHQHFNEFFDFGFGGDAGGGEPSFFENHRITYRMYMNSILERSHTQPFIIFGYSSYCHFCFRMEHIWKEAVSDLEALGYGISTVNALTDGVLLEKLRVTTLPSIVVLVEGRVVHFRKSFNGINAKSIRLFARDVIPTTFLHRITTHVGLRRFLDQWKTTNRISVLMLGTKEEPRLRYYLTAMKYSHFARFAYVFLGSHQEDVQALRTALNIKCRDCENVIIFKEEPEKGEAARITVSTNQFSQTELQTIIEKNKFLQLPRLSSMQYFDELCPTSSRSLRHYCIILPVTDSESDEPYISALYRFTKAHPRSEKSKMKISYIFSNRQAFFLEHFSTPKSDENGNRKSILVLWRNEYVKAKYVWLDGMWNGNELEEYKTFETLKEKLHLIERGNLRLDETAKIVNLQDEHLPSWFTRLSRRAVRAVETVWFYISKEEALPVLSVVGSFFVIMLCGYVLNAAFNPDKKRASEKQQDWHPEDPRSANTPQRNESMRSTASSRQTRILREMEPMIHELRAETYFGLIRLLKPGCRSIIVLVDKESKEVLLHQFARYVYPLRNNKTFSFGYLMIDKNLTWFQTLLEQILPGEDGEGSVNSASTIPALKKLRGINPKHTLGTVLILCGYKLYFSMYHPMYKTAKAPDSDDEISSDSDGNKSAKKKLKANDLNIENVLNGFPNFLDRLLEGSIPRFYIPEWPDCLK
uniref:J domain-containing protein n=1 Tax=Panagrolaimus sp. PS1159 TaxID=55785 RepID=A0AC35FBY1_9BILA